MDRKRSLLIKVISAVNSSLTKFKKGGWIKVERVPDQEKEPCEDLEQFVDAVFNRECYNLIPEFAELEELLGGHLFSCSLKDVDENKKRYGKAIVKIVTEKSIINPTESLTNRLKTATEYLGGSSLEFNGVRVKIKLEIKK